LNYAKSDADAATNFPKPNLLPAMIAVQKKFFERFEGINRDWVCRIQSRVKLASDFVCKLTAAQSIPDAPSACQKCASRQLTKDSRRFLADSCSASARMKVGDFMTKRVVSVRPDALAREAARLMLEGNISGLPVTDSSGHVVGIVTEHDLLRRHTDGPGSRPPRWIQLVIEHADIANDAARLNDEKVEEVMTHNPLTVTEDTAIEEACRLIEEHGIRRLPVVGDGRLVGVVARADLLRALVTAVSRISRADERAARAEALLASLQIETIMRRSRSQC
jgi:CBS domain-containing protein